MTTSSADRSTPVGVVDARTATPTLPPALRASFVRAADAFAFSSALAAWVGGALTHAVGLALARPSPLTAAALVGCSVFFIYTVDRLRDLERDREGSPIRTAFVERHRRGLMLASGVAALVAAGILAGSTAPIVALCAVIGAVGLLHRRLKHALPWKLFYVTAAWTAACVGIPWLARGGEIPLEAEIWAALLVGAGLLSNLIASNLRDGKQRRARPWREPMLAAAGGVSLGAAVLVVVAPETVAPLAWIPAAEAVALGCFRSSERYAHLAIDGALLLGSGMAIGQLGA